jgi:hypothetical protein
VGYAHQLERAAQLAALRSGRDLCPRCRRPMYRWQRLDLGDAKARVLGGGQVKRLEHASCNRRHGQQLGQALRKAGIRRNPSTGQLQRVRRAS